MIKYLKEDAWSIIEEGFHADYNEISESVFSIGNGRMGQRANFEEKFTGKTLQGSYVAGVYYPDKTRVGWWKNGYPEYFAKVLNSANWIGINISVENEELDLATSKVSDFYRELNMKEGYLLRSFKAKLPSGKEIKIRSTRFCSMADDELGAIKYEVTPVNFDGEIEINPYLDFDVINSDSNYDEKFWAEVSKETTDNSAFITSRTKKLDFHVCAGVSFHITNGDDKLSISSEIEEKEKFIGHKVKVSGASNKTITVYKYAAILSSENYAKDKLTEAAKAGLDRAEGKGFEAMLADQAAAWESKWHESDIIIEGDITAQQGIRFNIFQLNQTYTGEDERLNIGPKGFTGEKYGGSTYWDTEAYCLAFYLSTADEKVARNLLLYRYKHLQKAIENAEKLGFSDGAALYPMVTMNGEECHNEWEITFEEIHRNGAIARAIFDYTNYTGDRQYVVDYGIEVLIGIARFWSQRVNYSADKNKYVMLGVTGPNEYENNVNNNWYTNTMATWCMQYALDCIDFVQSEDASKWATLKSKISFDQEVESAKWKDIIDNMYYPIDDSTGIFMQQDGYMDKEQILVKDLDPKHLPINQNWSWDRILRSCYIKQADVLQGVYVFEDRYDMDTIRKNYEFYEPRTVHESSLSPCVHSILAAKLGATEKSYEMYLRTARLDLDNYNNDTEDGCHITSMAGSWMSVVQGFAGMRVRNGLLHFNPFIPEQWGSYTFKITFRGAVVTVKVDKNGVSIDNESEKALDVKLYDQDLHLEANGNISRELLETA